ncbi:hypothetical protein KZ829_27165 [Actinoplanes hulinensis]|uniref:Transposase n=1 Tax=Actinoplanes hulinensis TaxID=1144547 RepID=A0ABS7B8Z5_9ACTN|nr:hypothetical protein [Actinoplanes hulinensis]MBW6437420.1 hypothetical protein [Actinoplanes hulinensis]
MTMFVDDTSRVIVALGVESHVLPGFHANQKGKIEERNTARGHRTVDSCENYGRLPLSCASLDPVDMPPTCCAHGAGA